MIEMREIEDRLQAQGLEGVALHFAAIGAYETAHRNDPTYRQRQAKWLATQTANTHQDLLRVALEQIRDGHNNPRALAAAVLG